MHVPDGYLGPETLAVGWAACIPAWYVANRRTKALLSEPKAVPVLAASAAFSFLIMMLNVPVFGGTTAHAVGAVLIAVIAGPWVAVLAVTAALVIQALLFADGGILAIGINCLNMAVVMPLVGYSVYQLVAGGSDLQSGRRLVAAAAGAYVGVVAAATMVGIELGIQPALHTVDGVAQYAPYGLRVALAGDARLSPRPRGPHRGGLHRRRLRLPAPHQPRRLPRRRGAARLVSLARRGGDRADRGRAARAASHGHGLGRVGQRGAAGAHRLRAGGVRPLRRRCGRASCPTTPCRGSAGRVRSSSTCSRPSSASASWRASPGCWYARDAVAPRPPSFAGPLTRAAGGGPRAGARR